MSNVPITGANSGFAVLTARKFTRAGHAVHTGFRSRDREGEQEASARELPNVRPVRLDVTDQALIDGAITARRPS